MEDCFAFWKAYKFDTKLFNRIADISKYIGVLEVSYIPTSLRQAVTRHERIKALLEYDDIPFELDSINNILTGAKQSLSPVEQDVYNLNIAYEQFGKEPVRRRGTIQGIYKTLSQGMDIEAVQIEQRDNAFIYDESAERLRIWMGSSGEHPMIKAGVFNYVFPRIYLPSQLIQRIKRFCVVSTLAQWNPVIAALPLENMLLKSKDAYDKASHVGPNKILELLSDDILDILVAQVKCCKEALLIPESQKQLVNKLVRRLMPTLQNGALPAVEIMSKLELRDIRSFRRNYLSPAIKLNLVGSTAPKRTSPHQEYALTQKGLDFINTH